MYVRVCENFPDLAPVAVILNTVDGQSDHLHISFLELSTELGSSGQLRGADRGEVLRVGKENAPAAEEKVPQNIQVVPCINIWLSILHTG